MAVAQRVRSGEVAQVFVVVMCLKEIHFRGSVLTFMGVNALDSDWLL